MTNIALPAGYADIDYAVLEAPGCQVRHNSGVSFRFANGKLEELGLRNSSAEPWFPMVVEGAKKFLDRRHLAGW